MSTNFQGSTIIHSRPCVICRKRRVKCDRTRPCSNCLRSKQLCTYEGNDVGTSVSLGRSAEIHNGIVAADAGVLDRLTRLEALMAAMMERGGGGGGSSSGSQGTSPKDSTRDDTTIGALNSSFAEAAPSQLRLTASTSSYNSNTAPVGQILFQDGYSAYFDSQFWPGVISEVDDLRRLLSPPIEDQEDPSWLAQSSVGLKSISLDLSSQHPTLEESNSLCKLFFENVNPFTRIIHESFFGQALNQYRRGTFILPREFEALLFSVYLITVNSLRPEVVESTFLTKKEVLISRFENATQTALSNVNYLKSDKIWTLVALVHYLTYLFHRNNHQDAIPLLGITVHLGQTMGHHRDPSHFPFSYWVHEIRRRIWNQISILDSLAIHSYGSAESILPPTADTQSPKNANDEEWHPSRFAKPSTIPQNSSGFKDMTFVLVMREIANLIRSLLGIGDVREGEAMIRDVEVKLNEKYLRYLDLSVPSQSIIIAMTEIKLSSLRLRLLHQKTKLLKENPNKTPGGRNLLLTTSLSHLETIEYHIQTFSTATNNTTISPHHQNQSHPRPKPHLITSNPNYATLILNEIPWLATALTLTQTPHTTNKTDLERAQHQIDMIFQRYGGDQSSERSMKGSRIWRLLVELRDQVDLPWRSRRRRYQDDQVQTQTQTQTQTKIQTQSRNIRSQDRDRDRNYIDDHDNNDEDDGNFDLGSTTGLPVPVPVPIQTVSIPTHIPVVGYDDYVMRDFLGGEEDPDLLSTGNLSGNLMGGGSIGVGIGVGHGNFGGDSSGLMYDDPLDLNELPNMPWLDTQMPF